MFRVPRPTAAQLLARSIEQGEALRERASLIGDFSDYESWKGARKLWIEQTVETLGRICEGPLELDRFKSEASCPAGGQQWQVEYRHDSSRVRAAIDVLVALRAEAGEAPPARSQPAPEPDFEREPADRAQPEPEPDFEQEPAERVAPEPSPDIEFARPPVNGSCAALPAATPAQRGPRQKGRVFLVHGRNEKLKQAVADLLKGAGAYEVTVVNERPSDRRMLVEQAEDPSEDSRYAVILLTADDVGAPRIDSECEPYYSPRARQGVVFEMGVLVAALTPRRMCVLYEDGVELPFDLDGIAYVRFDLAGAWRSKLLLHMRRAGLEYDLNCLAPICDPAV